MGYDIYQSFSIHARDTKAKSEMILPFLMKKHLHNDKSLVNFFSVGGKLTQT